PVGEHHVGRDEVVAGQPAAAGEVADPAAEGEPGHPGRGDDPAGRGQAEGVRGGVEVAPGGAALGAGRPVGGVDAYGTHSGQVDHHAVAGAEAGHAVPAAAHGHLQVALPGVPDGGDDVARVGAPHDEPGMAVDHGVVDGAGPVVPLVGGCDHRPPYVLPQFLQHIDPGHAGGPLPSDAGPPCEHATAAAP